jgi:HEAT repeat protein
MRASTLLLGTILLSPFVAGQQRPADPAPMADEKYGTAPEIMALPPAKLIALLGDPGASVYAKAKACQRLGAVGDKSAVPALAALLIDPQLGHYARVGLEAFADPSVDEALRAALDKAQGKMLIGVINSIAARKDARAIEPLAKLLRHPDSNVARAVELALACIRSPR